MCGAMAGSGEGARAGGAAEALEVGREERGRPERGRSSSSANSARRRPQLQLAGSSVLCSRCSSTGTAASAQEKTESLQRQRLPARAPLLEARTALFPRPLNHLEHRGSAKGLQSKYQQRRGTRAEEKGEGNYGGREGTPNRRLGEERGGGRAKEEGIHDHTGRRASVHRRGRGWYKERGREGGRGRGRERKRKTTLDGKLAHDELEPCISSSRLTVPLPPGKVPGGPPAPPCFRPPDAPPAAAPPAGVAVRV